MAIKNELSDLTPEQRAEIEEQEKKIAKAHGELVEARYELKKLKDAERAKAKRAAAKAENK